MSEEYIWQGRHCDLKASERAVIFGFWDKKRRLYPQTVFFFGIDGVLWVEDLLQQYLPALNNKGVEN